MTTEAIIKACSKIHNGSFFKIQWKTNCDKKMCAAFRKSGNVVTKYVSSVCRKGISYGNIKKVQDQKTKDGDFYIDPKTGKKMYVIEPREWAEDVIPGLIVKHKKTGKHYMLVYASETKPKVQYYLNNKPISVEALKKTEIMQNSYWNTSEAIVMTVPVESIISIN